MVVHPITAVMMWVEGTALWEEEQLGWLDRIVGFPW